MENNPTETTKAVEVEAEIPATTNPEAEAPADADGSTSTEDLTALIEEEKKRGKPDPEKAKQRIQKKLQPGESEDDETDDDDRPLTRREMEAMLAENAHRQTIESQGDRLIEISETIAESPQEAELIRSIHANRVFPMGMSLAEQLSEAKAIANVKRLEAQKSELARKVQSQQTVSRNTATTYRDPQKSLEPELAPDLKASMTRSGYVFNGTSRRYEKKLPNGKTLVKENGRPPYLAG